MRRFGALGARSSRSLRFGVGVSGGWLLRQLDRRTFGVALCLVPTLLLHLRTLTFGFHIDDVTYLPRLGFDVGGLLFHPWYFRPFTAMTVLAAKAISGSHPFGYHAINVVLHLVNTWLVFILAAQILGRRPLACVAALIWGVFVLNSYPILWIIDGLLPATLLSLAAVTAFVRSLTMQSTLLRGLAAGCLALALLSKESAIPIVVILWVTAWRFGGLTPLKALRMTLPFASILLVYLLLRGLVLQGRTFRVLFGGQYLVLGEGDVSLWLIGAALNYLRQLAFILVPLPSIPLDTAGAVFVAAELLAVGNVGWLIWRQRSFQTDRRQPLTYALVWCVAATLPFVTGSHPRQLYLATVGLALGLAAATGMVFDANLSHRLIRPVFVTSLGVFVLSNVTLSLRIQDVLSPGSPAILAGYALALATPPSTTTEFESKLRAYIEHELGRHGCLGPSVPQGRCSGDPGSFNLNELFSVYQPGVWIRRRVEGRP